jgi:hypothetical protein
VVSPGSAVSTIRVNDAVYGCLPAVGNFLLPRFHHIFFYEWAFVIPKNRLFIILSVMYGASRYGIVKKGLFYNVHK